MFKSSILLAAAAFMFSSTGLSNSEEFRVDEIRFGGSWVNPDIFGDHLFEPDQTGITAEVLFSAFDFDYRDNSSSGLIRNLLTPKLHVGGLLNLSDNGVNSFYSGLTWKFRISDRFFLEPTFGGVIHDGRLHRPATGPRTRSEFGSRILFRESVAIGLNINEKLNLILQAVHISHAGLAGDDNAGQTDFNIKLGYIF